MAENEAGGAVAEQEKDDFVYPVQIEDAGPATKKVTIEIPRERIDEKLSEQFKELRQQAAIPGFRPGHAPQKLVEKRFSADVKEQVRRTLIGESYEQALEKNDLQVIGEPEFEDPEKIKLPDDGPLSYSFQVEVMPDITLPDLGGLRVRKPNIEVSEENVEQALANLREQQGTLVPVEDRGVEGGDYLIADVHVKSDGNEVTHQHDAQIVARPGRIAGIQVDDLDHQLAGLKAGETRTINAKAADTHPNEAIRGKDVQIDVKLNDLKRIELPEVSQEFLDDLGFKDEKELRDALRDQMAERINADVQRSMRDQVKQYLLDRVPMQLPEKLSERQADRVISRRMLDLMMRGMPREQVEANVEQLQSGAREEAARELKLFFILQKVAAEQNVDVDEAEMNGQIAMLAIQRGQRPEKLKQEMAGDGTLQNLYVQMREQKALDQILGQAQVDEVELPAEKK